MFYSIRITKKMWGGALLAVALCAAALFAGTRFFPQPEAVGCAAGDLGEPEAVFTAGAADSGAQDGTTGAENGGTPEKVVYLTFDDGPSATTEKVLDVLKAEGVPGTFFVMASENNEEHLPLITRAVEEGNMIALHTCSHDYKKIYKSTDAYWNDLQQLRDKITPYLPTGYEIHWLRFPGGSTNTVSHRYGGSSIMKNLKAQAGDRGFHYADWNVCADDSLGGHPSASRILQNIVGDAKGKDTCIVLMHDTSATKNTAAALPDIIRWFKNEGYRFDTIDHYKSTKAVEKSPENKQI